MRIFNKLRPYVCLGYQDRHPSAVARWRWPTITINWLGYPMSTNTDINPLGGMDRRQNQIFLVKQANAVLVAGFVCWS
jgi:hypothetical protein